ncbi:hypothetical protein [Mesorhizobium sp.]|uniref:hypothetical protein n=1 Tax=Mesorhizobium sp. TaxID=1871066 RepID=UPI001209CF11|nr:hypothetical protein [Mesorhizobium sp.]TIM48778.1 MAG: hypothetical protein E5Y56_06135 [Mesorhizobium sp.]
MTYLIVFAIAVLIALVVTIRSQMGLMAKAITAVGIIVFAIICYATSSAFFSPFAPHGSRVPFGAVEDTSNLLAAIVGTVGGIVGSVYFKAGGKLSLVSFLRPLCCAPLTLIPILKLINGTEQLTVLGIATLVVTAYQTGFFWERLLKDQGNNS